MHNKVGQLHTSAVSRFKFAGGNICTSLQLILIRNSVVIYRLHSPQASCTASANETHCFGWELKCPESCAMWKRTYGSLSSSPTFLNNLDRTLSILSPPWSQQTAETSSCFFPVGLAAYQSWKNKENRTEILCCHCTWYNKTAE